MKMMLCQNILISMMKLLFLSFLQKNIKTERTCEELLEESVTLAEKLEITKKAAAWPEISCVKKSASKNLQLTWLFIKTTKYKAIQPLLGMDLQRSYKKANLLKLTYFLVKNSKYKAIQPLFGMELQRSKRISFAT